MKFRLSAIIAVILCCAIFIGAYAPQPVKNENEKERLIMMAVLSFLENWHFSDKAIDDAFSKKVFKTYIRRMDNGKRFLTQEDLDLLDDYEMELDDALRESDTRFFERSYKVIGDAIKKVQLYYPEILSQPFDFTIPEKIETDPDKRSFAQNDVELKEYWRQYLKYEVLTRVVDKLDAQEEADDPEGGKKSLAELEAESREKVMEVMDDWFDRLQKLRRSDRFEVFLNSMTNVYDPHTDYFNPKDKQDFNINMSGRLEGIGARLQMDGDFTKVVSIVPGGPAYKQKELEVNDKIYKVAQEGDDPVDVVGMHIDDVVSKIRGKKGTKVTLHVKNADGLFKEITITRDEVIIDEGFAKSLILDYPEKMDRVGYIRLPRFYADFENPDGRSCADDVALELEKLQKEGINALILDLRNNSGGSLNDVVKMVGLFIEDGPVVQVKGRKGDPYIFRDKDKSVQYAGPMVVMVNAFSASASEILAAALQDYGRAVIIGSESTFGKGTVQRFYNLDRLVKGNSAEKPLGELKLTVQKFYRINGGSTQLKGVIPDISLPDRFLYREVGEKELDYPMEWSEISELQYDRIAELTDVDLLRIKSEQRITGNPVFQKVKENAKRLKEVRKMTEIPVQLDSYRKMIKDREEESRAFKNMFPEYEALMISNLRADLKYIQEDSSRIARNDAWIKNIKKDAYIDETLSILRDMTMLD